MSYNNSRVERVSQISKLNLAKVLISNIVLNNKVLWKYNLFSDQTKRIPEEFNNDEDFDEFRDFQETKKENKLDYFNKLAQPNIKIDTSKDTIGLIKQIQTTECTCSEKLRKSCTPLHPLPGCNRRTRLFSTEDERNNCTFQPFINSFVTHF